MSHALQSFETGHDRPIASRPSAAPVADVGSDAASAVGSSVATARRLARPPATDGRGAPSSGTSTAPSDHDPYAFLDIEPDFAWRSADGRQVRVTTLGEDSEPPQWLRNRARERRRARLVDAAAWLVTAGVLACVVLIAGVVMLGSDRFAAVIGEVTGLELSHGALFPQARASLARPAAAPADVTTGATPTGDSAAPTSAPPAGTR